jgi:hypothetical protein
LLESGYIQFSPNGVNYFYITEQNPCGSLSICVSIKDGEQNWFDYDTAHPFVTKDKNGKDVFDGDRIRGFCVLWKRGVEGEVNWDELTFTYCVPDTITPKGKMAIRMLSDIELIEDKENENSN